MPTLIPADGLWLARVLESRGRAGRSGLSPRASRLFHAAQLKTTWGRRSQRSFALVDGETLLASAEQYDLAGVLDHTPVRICGIGSLCTDSAQGGRGDARTLVESLLDRAARDGADVALLFPSVYPSLSSPLLPPTSTDLESAGRFHSIPLGEVVLEVAAPPRRGAPMTLVRGGETRDLPAIVAMGRARAASSVFHLDRDVDVVHYAITRQRLLAGLGAPDARQLHFFIAEEGTTAAAYVVLSVVPGVEPQWTLEECGDRDPSGARVGALLQALIARQPAERRPTIVAALPPGFLPLQVSIASTLPSTGVLMVRRLQPGCPPLDLSPRDVLWWKSDHW